MLPAHFMPRPMMALDASAEAGFEAIYAAQVGRGGLLSYNISLPKWQFLCWLADTKGVLLHGSGNGGIREFEPRKADDIKDFGDQRAVYAASDGLWPIYFAVLDKSTYPMTLLNACFRIEPEETGTLSEPFYFFSISREAFARQPWCSGFVYLLPRDGFIPQPMLQVEKASIHIAQWANAASVKPLACLAVGPEDFPFLAQIRGHDDTVVWDKAAADPQGFPWLDDEIN